MPRIDAEVAPELPRRLAVAGSFYALPQSPHTEAAPYVAVQTVLPIVPASGRGRARPSFEFTQLDVECLRAKRSRAVSIRVARSREIHAWRCDPVPTDPYDEISRVSVRQAQTSATGWSGDLSSVSRVTGFQRLAPFLSREDCAIK